MSSISVPLSALEMTSEPILLSAEDGRVRFCNSAAAGLFGRNRRDALNQPCWRVARFRYPDGRALCSPRCPIMARAGEERHRHMVVRVDGDDLSLDLLAFSIPAVPSNGGTGVLHMLHERRVPVDAVVRNASDRSDPAGVTALSRREKEVLGRLASGGSTLGIADDLCISPVTVRNHVGSILRKLSVHNRLGAVLLWVRSRP